jgi:hypothetical protein
MIGLLQTAADRQATQADDNRIRRDAGTDLRYLFSKAPPPGQRRSLDLSLAAVSVLVQDEILTASPPQDWTSGKLSIPREIGLDRRRDRLRTGIGALASVVPGPKTR